MSDQARNSVNPTVPKSIFDSNMACLFCGNPVEPPHPESHGWICSDEDCGVYYFFNGLPDIDTFPEGYKPDGSIPVVQDMNHGCYWHWCPYHREYERDGPFEPSPPCVRRTQELTPLLSG